MLARAERPTRPHVNLAVLENTRLLSAFLSGFRVFGQNKSETKFVPARSVCLCVCVFGWETGLLWETVLVLSVFDVL